MTGNGFRPLARIRLAEARRHQGWSQGEMARHLGTTQVNVSRWECGITTPSQYFRIKLATLLKMTVQELLQTESEEEQPQQESYHPAEKAVSVPLRSVSSGFWNIPYARNAFFTGREELLHELHARLGREHTMALTQACALSGLGGIGKTQIALEYAYRYRHEYRAVFWLSAATQETLLPGLVTTAEIVGLPEKDKHDQTRLMRAVKQWFASHQEWLLILDNVEDISVLQTVVPTEHTGYLLLTTRAQALGALAQRIEVDTMGMAEATLFLLRRTRLLAPEAVLDQTSDAHLAAAEALVIEMDFLPLALDQAGAYIDEVGCSLSAYLDLYRTHRKALLHRRGHIPNDHPESVATTWSLSFEKIEQISPAAAELLRLCAFLDPDAIPEELICEGSAHLGPVLGPLAMDALALGDAIQHVRRFSLVQRDPDARLLRLHRLVQAVLKDAMDTVEQSQWAERAIRATNTVFPETVEIATWPQCRRVLPQAQACSVLIQTHAFVFPEAASLLCRTACYLEDFALYEQAEPLFQHAVRIWEHTLGPGHPTVAHPLTRLAHLYWEQGKHEQAESLFQRAVCIQEHALGPDHPDVAASLNGLANLYRQHWKHEQAESLYQRAMCIQEHALGLDHPGVATSLNGLAVLYKMQGKYEQAESLFQRAVRIQEHALGPDHPDVALSFNNLANLSREQGKYAQAESLYLRALHIWEQGLGPDHPDVGRVFNNLANLYREQGKYEQAESLYLRALHIWEQGLGPDHHAVALLCNNLADLSFEQRKYEQAESLYQRAWTVWEQALGPEHPRVAFSLNGLANLYRDQHVYAQAEPLYQRALHIREQALGPDHPDVAASLNGLANLYRDQHVYEQAEPLYQRALHIRERTQQCHPDLATLLYDIAAFQQVQGNYQAAADLYQRALGIQKQALPAQHPATIATEKAYAEVLQIMAPIDDRAGQL